MNTNERKTCTESETTRKTQKKSISSYVLSCVLVLSCLSIVGAAIYVSPNAKANEEFETSYGISSYDDESTSFETFATSGNYAKFASDDIAHGWSNTCPWSVDKNGVLHLWEGTPASTHPYYNSISVSSYNSLSASDKQSYYYCQDGYYWSYANNSNCPPWGVYRDRITSAVVDDSVDLVDAWGLFAGLKNMKTIELPKNMRNCTDLMSAFDGCISLTSVDLSHKDILALTSFRYTFRNCEKLQWVWLNDIDTSQVTNMRYMFQSCRELVNVDVANFSTDSLVEISGMFWGCVKLTSVDFSSYTIPAGTENEVGAIFASCPSIKRINFGNNTFSAANYQFSPTVPTTAPYTGKWVKEDDPSIVLTTAQLVANYPNATAPAGTYVWQVQQAVIEYDANGGNTSLAKVVQTTPTEITIPGETSATRDGYQLVSWNTQRNGSGKTYFLNQKHTPMLNTNLFLYAQWKKISDYPDRLVNGDFEYFPDLTCTEGANMNSATMVSLGTNTWYDWFSYNRLELPPTFDHKEFGWHSTQVKNTGTTAMPDDVEIDTDRYSGNRCAQVLAEEAGTAIFQDIRTIPGSIYKWTLKHCVHGGVGVTNSCSVLIGPPGNTVAQEGTRTTNNGSHDVIGQKSAIITTTRAIQSRGGYDFDNEWETYAGLYIVPDGQTLTRFSFLNISGANELDDIEFSRSFPVYYDMNDNNGTNVRANRNGIYEDSEILDNGAQGYANEDTDFVLTNKIPMRDGYKFCGWSLSQNEIIDVDTPEATKISILDSILTDGTCRMNSEAIRLYAVWAVAPEVVFDYGEGGGEAEGGIVTGVSPEPILPSYEYVIRPQEGYGIFSVYVNGVELEGFPTKADVPYTLSLSNVAGHNEIVVTFVDRSVDMPETGTPWGALLVLSGMTVTFGVLGLMARREVRERR